MKCILTIGYTDILLPDHKGVEKIIDMLSKGAVCNRRYRGSTEAVEIREELEVEFRLLPPSTEFTFSSEMEEKAVKIIKPPKGLGNKQKALPFKG